MSGDVRRFLEDWVTAFEGPAGELQRFVLAHGREWTAARLPRGVRRGQTGMCFMNATLLAFNRIDLTYCEGWAYRPGLIPLEHAWCVDRGGRVLDPTWDRPEICEYYGVRIDTDRLMDLVGANGYYGLFQGPRGLNLGLVRQLEKEFCEWGLTSNPT